MYIQSKHIEIDPIRRSVAEQHTAKIIYNLIVGRPVDAVAAVEQCRADLDEMASPMTRETTLQDLFAHRNSTNQTLNAIEEHLGAWTLGDLLDLNPEKLAAVPNIGPVELVKILQALIYRLPVTRFEE